jgi:DNA-binding response OmpR family regulator
MRILLVEDDPKVASFIRKGLEEEQYRVDLAPDGDEALAQALGGEHDLLILDLMLPHRDGMSVLTEMRRRGVDTPVLVLTAKDTVEDRVAGLNAGSDDYLSKPFAFAELLARTRALLRRRAGEKSIILRVADLALDPLAHRVSRAGRSIELTSREYSLLQYLLQHPNQVLTRTMIVEHVWGYDFDNFSNVVDVYVNYLRNKVDRGFEPKLIHTVRGVGYVLKAPRPEGEGEER